MKRAWLLCLVVAACEDSAAPPPAARADRITIDQARSQPSSAQAIVGEVHHEVVVAQRRSTCDKTFAPSAGVKLEKFLTKRPTWVNVWAGWCKPCVAEIPMLIAWSKRHDFELVLVSVDDDERQWRQMAKQLGLSEAGPHVRSLWLETAAQRKAAFAGTSLNDTAMLPVHFLLGADGRVRCVRNGAIESDEGEAFAALLTN